MFEEGTAVLSLRRGGEKRVHLTCGQGEAQEMERAAIFVWGNVGYAAGILATENSGPFYDVATGGQQRTVSRRALWLRRCFKSPPKRLKKALF